MTTTSTRNNPAELLHVRLAEWLTADRPSAAILVDWLQGYHLPPVGDEEEPHVWLLRAVAIDPDRVGLRLAHVVARLLRCAPDVQLAARLADEAPASTVQRSQLAVTSDDGDIERVEVRWPTSFLYNLFMLAAGLRHAGRAEHDYSAVLLPPLQEMLERSPVPGAWRGTRLSDALMAALAANQVDDRFHELWLSHLLTGVAAGGDPYTAYRGTAFMPGSVVHRDRAQGQPSLDAIGASLTEMGGYLEGRLDAAQELRALIRVAEGAWPNYAGWNRGLLMQAHARDWPAWMVGCLPSLCFPLAAQSHGGLQPWAIWIRYLPAVAEGPNVIKTLWCKNTVFEVWLERTAAEAARSVAQRIEPLRRAASSVESRVFLGQLHHYITEIRSSRIWHTPRLQPHGPSRPWRTREKDLPRTIPRSSEDALRNAIAELKRIPAGSV